jgi:hypothetical protein
MLNYKIKTVQNFEVITGNLPKLGINSNDNHAHKWIGTFYIY